MGRRATVRYLASKSGFYMNFKRNRYRLADDSEQGERLMSGARYGMKSY
jgi:hypothetical protein